MTQQTANCGECHYRRPIKDPVLGLCLACVRAADERANKAGRPLTHDELIKEAAAWLHRSRRSIVELMECQGLIDEIPDVIGFSTGGSSTLVECKTSLSDFRRDAKKPSRAASAGVGEWRYFFAERGLIPVAELPNGWGLVELNRETGRTLVAKEAAARTLDGDAKGNEVTLLALELRRITGGWRKPTDGVGLFLDPVEATEC